MSSIQKWGNSLAVRIPAITAKQLQLTAGTPVEIVAQDGVVLIRPKKPRKYRLKALLKGYNPKQRHREMNFGPDVGREVID